MKYTDHEALLYRYENFVITFIFLIHFV